MRRISPFTLISPFRPISPFWLIGAVRPTRLLGRAHDDLSGREVYRAASGVAVTDVLAGQLQAVLLVAGVLASRCEELLEHVEHGASRGPGSPAA